MSDLTTQIREYARQLDDLYPDVTFEEVAKLIEPVAEKRRRLSGPGIALAAAAIVMLVIGGIGILLLAEQDSPVVTEPVLPLPVPPVQDWFLGSWEPEDQTSEQVLEVRDAGDGTFVIELIQNTAEACGGIPGTSSGRAEMISATEMGVTWEELTCADGEIRTGIEPTSFVFDLEAETLESGGIVWRRLSADPSLFRWSGFWPQSTLQEIEEAQRLSDEGDPAFDWQKSLDPANGPGEDGGAPVATRYLEEMLGWVRFQLVAGGGGGDIWDQVFIRCEPGVGNPLYSNDELGAGCAPTLDDLHYETIHIVMRQPVKQTSGGLWVVTRVEELADSDRPLHPGEWFDRQYEQLPPPSEQEVGDFMASFLASRIAGDGAEDFVASDSPSIPVMYLASSGAAYRAARMTAIEWGPMWPYGSYLIVVELETSAGGIVEQKFIVRPDNEDSLSIVYLDSSTTENGTVVPELWGILDGEVTFLVPGWHESLGPDEIFWGSPWYRGVSPGDGATLIGSRNMSDGGGYYLIVHMDPWTVGDGCGRGNAASAGGLVQHIVSDPDLRVEAMSDVVVGGVEGKRLEVVPVEGAQECPNDYFGGVPVLHHQQNRDPWVVPHGSRMGLYLLDMPSPEGPRPLVIMLIATEDQYEEALRAAQPILDSFSFKAG